MRAATLAIRHRAGIINAMDTLTPDDRALVRELANPALPMERIAEARGMSLAALRERLRAPALRAEVAARRALTRLRAELIAGEAPVAALARLHIHAVDEPASHAGADRVPWYARESSRKSAALLLRTAPAQPRRRDRAAEPPRPPGQRDLPCPMTAGPERTAPDLTRLHAVAPGRAGPYAVQAVDRHGRCDAPNGRGVVSFGPVGPSVTNQDARGPSAHSAAADLASRAGLNPLDTRAGQHVRDDAIRARAP